ncbi:hypothetical protein ES703_08680 [subsurface metagenome]
MDELEALQAQQAVYSEFRVSPKAIKPCAAYILHHNPKSKISNPNDHAFFIAVDLKRIGEKKEETAKILQIWNSRNSLSLKLNELNGLIDRVYSRPYDYGCNGSMAREYCPEKENCTYYKALFARKGRHRERDFYKYGWQQILKNYETCLYQGLKELESREGLKPGSLIIAPYRHIHKASGVTMSLIEEAFTRLEKLGLIWWQKGEPYKWREKATEIRRIIPIPRPKNDAKMRGQNA